jgi:hypothetical protein
VDVQDSRNTNSTDITAATSHDAGNNTKWVFSPSALTWQGATNAAWDYAGNWSAGYVPNATDNVTVSKAGGIDLELNFPATVNNLTIDASNTVSVNGQTLTITGTFTNNGSLDPGTGTVVFGGGAQTVPGLTYHNLTLGGTNTKTAGGGLTVNGTMTINSGVTFSAGAYTHALKGNWANSGTLSAGTSRFAFNGTSPQTMSGSTFYDITFNNAAGITMLTDETASNSITLSSGIINTGSNTLYVTSPASDAVVCVDGWIVGKLSRAVGTPDSTYLFPLGTATDYRGATLAFTTIPSTNSILGTYVTGDPGSVGLPIVDGTGGPIPTLMNNSGKDGVWKFLSGSASTPAFDLALRIDNYPNIAEIAGLRIIKRDAGLDWTMEGLYAAPGSNLVNRTGLSGFTASDDNEYDIVGGSNNPLPVELTSFSASRAGSTVLLRWKTATESNNYGFDIERSSDALAWTTSGFVAGAGTTSAPREYSFTDTPDPAILKVGALWYRLKQRDRDGSVRYSPVVRVAPASDVSARLIEVYPQPLVSGSRNAMLHFALDASGDVSLRLFDALGRDAGSLAQGWFDAGSHTLSCTLPLLNVGTYFLTLTADGHPLRTQVLQIVR